MGLKIGIGIWDLGLGIAVFIVKDLRFYMRELIRDSLTTNACSCRVVCNVFFICVAPAAGYSACLHSGADTDRTNIDAFVLGRHGVC